MSADNLSHVGRNFYEWSLMKTVLGILYFGLAVFYLGMVARGNPRRPASLPPSLASLPLTLTNISWRIVTSLSSAEEGRGGWLRC